MQHQLANLCVVFVVVADPRDFTLENGPSHPKTTTATTTTALSEWQSRLGANLQPAHARYGALCRWTWLHFADSQVCYVHLQSAATSICKPVKYRSAKSGVAEIFEETNPNQQYAVTLLIAWGFQFLMIAIALWRGYLSQLR